MSSFFLISGALFMGGGFCVLQRKELHDQRAAEAEGAAPGTAQRQRLSLADSEGAEKPLRTEVTYVTSV